MGRKSQQRRAAKAAKPSYGPGGVTETRLAMAARSFPDCGCGGTQDLDACPNCDALYGEEGDADDGHWWRTCHECSDPELPGEDPNSEPLNWCAACGVTRRGFM